MWNKKIKRTILHIILQNSKTLSTVIDQYTTKDNIVVGYSVFDCSNIYRGEMTVRMVHPFANSKDFVTLRCLSKD